MFLNCCNFQQHWKCTWKFFRALERLCSDYESPWSQTGPKNSSNHTAASMPVKQPGVGVTNTGRISTKSFPHNACSWLANAKSSANHNWALCWKLSVKSLLILVTNPRPASRNVPNQHGDFIATHLKIDVSRYIYFDFQACSDSFSRTTK